MAIRSSAATTTAMYVNSPIDGKVQESVLDELIEQNWFFENLFNTTREKEVMLRSYSDPFCPSSKCPDGAEPPKGLIRAPSLPPNVEGGGGVKEKKGRKLTRQVSLQATTNQVKIKERDVQVKKGEARRSESTGQSSRHGLLRTPSLPPNIGRADVIEEEEEDDESEYRMSNLIQQALTRRNTMKVMTQGGTNEMKNGFLMNQKKTTKSLIELEIEEVQGFKKLVFNFDREDWTPGVVNLVPGLLENKKEHLHQNSNVRRPAPPPIPNCVTRKSEDVVKKQIKFWARAVASHASRAQFSF